MKTEGPRDRSTPLPRAAAAGEEVSLMSFFDSCGTAPLGGNKTLDSLDLPPWIYKYFFF